MIYNRIFELNDYSIDEAKTYGKKRFFFNYLANASGKHFIGIAGPRGVGKSVLLKQIAMDRKDSIYLSLDAINKPELFDIVKVLNEKFEKKIFLLDEIHYVKGFEQQLKMIYDFLPVRVIFTSSVGLSISKSVYDLSRRIKLYRMYPFSFREYVYFHKDIILPELSLNDIINKKWQPEHSAYEYLFDNYLSGGLYPFSLDEPDVIGILGNIRDKIIEKDIPPLSSLKIEELPLIRKVLEFISKSEVDGINYSSVSRNIGITKYKASEYLSLLEKTFICNILLPEGTNVLKEPKILLNLPYRLLYRDLGDATGAIREDFFVETLIANSIKVNYLKSKRGSKTPDYLISVNNKKVVIEVGGKGKGRKQFKGVSYDIKHVLSHRADEYGNNIPLFIMGYLG